MINADLFVDFLHLAQSRNFTATARERGMSQSTLSRRIAQLESYVGSGLFERAVHPVALTPAGETLLPLAQEMQARMREIHAIGHPVARPLSEHCTMIALSTLAVHFFPGWLSSHDPEGGNWRVNLLNTEPLLADNIGHFLSGRAEFLMTFAEEAVEDLAALSHHRYILLGEDTARPVSAPDPDGRPLWPLAGEAPISYCAYTRGSFYQQALRPLQQPLQARLHRVRDNSLAATLHSMVRQGHGMTWLPSFHIARDLASGALVRAGGPEYDLTTEIRLYRSHNMSRYAQAFWNRVSAGQVIRRRELRLG